LVLCVIWNVLFKGVTNKFVIPFY